MDVYEAGGFKADEFHEFFDTIWEAVTTKWRQRMMEADMRTRTILGEWKAEILEQGLEKGLEQGLEKGLEQGLEKGLEQGLRNSIQRVCETRGLKLESAHHDFLAECHDLHRLESLLDRAATAHDVKEVFES
jgi:flagellar biosynthesis/type III secretory pathway protein FliH